MLSILRESKFTFRQGHFTLFSHLSVPIFIKFSSSVRFQKMFCYFSTLCLLKKILSNSETAKSRACQFILASVCFFILSVFYLKKTYEK